MLRLFLLSSLGIWSLLDRFATAASSSLNATICSAVGDVIYKTEWERQHNPCSAECNYDTTSRHLVAECRYDYCKSCNTDDDICGFRVIHINHTFTEESLVRFTEGLSKLDIGRSKRYCIDYTDSQRTSKYTCIDIDDSFNTNCNEQYTDLPFGLPFLSCDDELGCRCANQATTKVDQKSPFIGFEVIPFDSCYLNETELASSSINEMSSSNTFGRNRWLIPIAVFGAMIHSIIW
jgi:hypothetical protein